MPHSKHIINDCIQSGRTGNTPDHQLDKIESTYQHMKNNLQEISEKLAVKETEYSQRQEYLKKLFHDKAVAKKEVPQLKTELRKLRDKLIALTFEADRWGSVCLQQENTIYNLKEKHTELANTLLDLKSQLSMCEEECARLVKENSDIVTAITAIDTVKNESEIFKHIVTSRKEPDDPDSLPVNRLIQEINLTIPQLSASIKGKEHNLSRSSLLDKKIADQKDAVLSAEKKIADLEQTITDKNIQTKNLDAGNDQMEQKILELSNKYQVYHDITEESNTIQEEKNSIVTAVNDANEAIIAALLKNNSLELSLRLEDLKMGLFFKEMESAA